MRNRSVKHGTINEYNTYNCRCDECKEAAALDRKRRRVQNPERYRKYERDWNAKNHDKYIEKSRQQNLRKRVERQTVIIEAKSQPCADCNQKFHYVCMDFDHIPERGPKLFGIASFRGSPSALRAEIAKCDIVCANCHRLRTLARRQWESGAVTPKKGRTFAEIK